MGSCQPLCLKYNGDRVYFDNAMNNDKISNQMSKYYKVLDEELSNLPTLCKKGCTNCCFEPVVVSMPEGKYVDLYLKQLQHSDEQEFKKIRPQWRLWSTVADRAKVSASITTLSTSTPLAARADKKSKVRCPFLVNQECSIYKVRPLMCRLVYNISSSVLSNQECTPGIDSNTYDKKYREILRIGLHKLEMSPKELLELKLLPGKMRDLFA